ncbi:phage protein Gp36 family protein [Limnovirga soli]|uniref:DUF1320 domain-containing protein n=1 Tax=Limnovirga soli TaxID=2656915 RepID=A0A8J8FDR9_9BACT|nr:phage protein Gp36 family protein [Limnovirga soli]NNV54539.1 DUF1320 domain-containing protein [Limnovirga soli]
MSYITKQDFSSNIYVDILDALTKGDDTIITNIADRSTDEVKAYLNGRYDTANIFNKEGDERHKYILRICLTLCTYYLYLAHNPRKLTEVVTSEFERAIETLEKIQAGKINPEGLPLPVEPATEIPGTTGGGQAMQWGSDEALGTSY